MYSLNGYSHNVPIPWLYDFAHNFLNTLLTDSKFFTHRDHIWGYLCSFKPEFANLRFGPFLGQKRKLRLAKTGHYDISEGNIVQKCAICLGVCNLTSGIHWHKSRVNPSNGYWVTAAITQKYWKRDNSVTVAHRKVVLSTTPMFVRSFYWMNMFMKQNSELLFFI